MRSKQYYQVFILIFLLSGGSLSAQQNLDRGELRRAIKSYRKGNFTQAKKLYQNILSQDSLQPSANYGQANVAYHGRRWDEALANYDRAVKSTDLTPEQSAAVWHNMGNTYMQKKDYAQAIKSYENALIANPSDEQTRYNLVLAQKLQQRNQQKQQSQNNQSNNSPQNNQNNQNKNDNSKDDKKQGDQSKDTENPNKQKEQNQQNQNQSPEEGKISKEQADQLLDAFKQDDDQTRRRYEERKRAKEKQNNKNKKRW